MKRVVFDHDIFGVIAHVHGTLLHAAKNKMYSTIYHGDAAHHRDVAQPPRDA